tara:strand:+ start:422 stop:676 length:255 start_codon:yes stop_codon:yes gene_type:complete
MSSQEKLVSEFNASVEEDLKKRKRSIEDGEALDKEIGRRMEAEEIGVTLGADHHVGVLMLGLATIVTLFALYMIFGVSPERING